MDIKIEIRDPRKGFWSDADTELSWSPNRYDHILKLRQQALNHARNMLVDYLFMIDADNILVQVQIYRLLSDFYTFFSRVYCENSFYAISQSSDLC